MSKTSKWYVVRCDATDYQSERMSKRDMAERRMAQIESCPFPHRVAELEWRGYQWVEVTA